LFSISEKFFQLVARGGFAGIGFVFRDEISSRHFKIFAEISDVFFVNRLRAAIAALVSRARIVARAIQANAQIRVAAMAGFASARLAGKRPFPAAVVTMSCHAIYPTK
jgi:hypothetical protein